MTTLEIGQKAPLFSGTDQNGNTLNLTDFLGSKLIVYFYPKDNTPGCTAEACNFRDNYASLLGKGFRVIGISADSEDSHKKFKDKFNLPFPLIADKDKSISKLYGTWGPKKMMGREYEGMIRTTFVIDEQGTIVLIEKKPDTKNASAQLLKDLEKA